MSDLTNEQQEFLLEIPDNPHSDYHEELNGWPNYWISDGELHITFQSDDGDHLEGVWDLKFKSGFCAI